MDELMDDVELYHRASKGFLGKIGSLVRRVKRKALGSVSANVNQSPGNNQQRLKRPKAMEEPPVFDAASTVSLCQNHYKCVPSLMVLLMEEEEVIVTFQQHAHLLSFLRSSNANPQACFQTKFTTIGGDCFALIGTVIENSPIVSEPFQLLKENDEDKQLYPSDGGLVLKLKRSTASSVDTQVVVKYSNAASKNMDLWTSRQTHDFEGLQESFSEMETEERLEAVSEMSKLLDPYQQIVWAHKFYKDFCEAHRRKCSELKRSSERAILCQEKETSKARRVRLSELDLKLEEIHRLQMVELSVEKLGNYSEFVNPIVDAALSKLTRDFSKFRTSLISNEDMTSIIERTKHDFPNSFSFQNGMILPKRVRGTDERKKELGALWGFISAIRKRNPRLCMSLAAIISLSLAGSSVSDNTIKFVCHLGIAASKDVLNQTMKRIAKDSANTWEWQAVQLFIVLFFDNMQNALPQKIQCEGRSTNMVEGTSRFARKVTPFVPPATVPFVTNEGQPKLTYVDQRVPAPVWFPPLETLTNRQFEKLLEYKDGLRNALQVDVLQRDILEQDVAHSSTFDVHKMLPSSGFRSDSYLSQLHKCLKYGAFWQFLSSDHTIEQSNYFIGPMTKDVYELLQIVKSARNVVLVNARRFQQECVRTWFPEFEEETLTFLYSVSIFREKTTEECAKVVVELLLNYGLLVMCADKKIRLRPRWEKHRVFMNGDQYSVAKGRQFAAKAATSLGRYSDDYESNMNISKAMSRILWTPGQLHCTFRMCTSIYVMFYGGFLHAFQAAGQVTRLVQDSTKCFQLATTFLKLGYDQVYRGFAFHWLLNRPTPLQPVGTIHDAVDGFTRFLQSMWNSDDEVYRYLACFLELCETYFLYLASVECADAFCCELILRCFQPIFYVCSMTNYKESVWHNMETLYGAETSIVDRETCRRNMMIRLNEGKNCIGTDTFGELINDRTVKLKKSKDIKQLAVKSAALSSVTQCDEFRNKYVCCEDVDKPPKSSTQKRTGIIRSRFSELAILCNLYHEQVGRKISDLDMYSQVDNLETPFPVKSNDDDDELTSAERADRERNATIDALVKGVIARKSGEVAANVNDNDDTDSEDEDSDEHEGTNMSVDGEAKEKTKKKKILTKANKLRIGSSTQDRMKIDPKGVAFHNPFMKGKAMIVKDNVKEKRARLKMEQHRKAKLAELCFLRCQRSWTGTAAERQLPPFPSGDHEDTQKRYDRNYSSWKQLK